jgi:DNA-binding transcriptional regulator YdaS (Cro superfamily)
MEYSLSLIDKAAEICGSRYKLAQRLKVSESNLASVKAGRRSLPLEWVPELAELAGVEPRDALARVMAERLPEGSRARALLGGDCRTGAAVMLLLCVVLGPLLPSTSYAKASADLTSYTSWNMRRVARYVIQVLRHSGLSHVPRGIPG